MLALIAILTPLFMRFLPDKRIHEWEEMPFALNAQAHFARQQAIVGQRMHRLRLHTRSDGVQELLLEQAVDRTKQAGTRTYELVPLRSFGRYRFPQGVVVRALTRNGVNILQNDKEDRAWYVSCAGIFDKVAIDIAQVSATYPRYHRLELLPVIGQYRERTS